MNQNKRYNKLFYKYQPINEYLFENLRHNQLYFRDPRTYNDPFDSKINGYLECTEGQWIEQCIKHHPGLNKEQAMIALNWNIKEGNYQRNNETGLIVGEALNDSCPLACCFSEDLDNILMWSHYADHHKGVSLSFKSTKKQQNSKFRNATEYGLTVNSEFVPLFKITYKNEMPCRINFLDMYLTEDPQPFFDFLLTKSPCWEYENEYRLISIDNINVKNFAKEELEGIIFGLKVKYCDVYVIHKIIEKNYLNKGIDLNFYKAQEIENEYGIKVKQINDMDTYIDTLCSKV